jgi:prevent-host-death family protein
MSITAAKARENFAEIINQVAYGKERMVLTRRGRELVAVIPIEDLKTLLALEDQIDLDEGKARLADIKEGREQTVPWDDVQKTLSTAPKKAVRRKKK